MHSFQLGQLDYLLFFVYLAALAITALIAGRGEKGTTNEYFLAGNSLPWYVVGSSLVASVLSTEQLIGMVGVTVIYGVSIGMWIWGLAVDITLQIFLWVPFLLASRVLTIPQFLERRYDARLRLLFAIVTIAINVFNFMAAVLYTGGLALGQLFGWELMFAVAFLGLVAGAVAIYGGLATVAWTDFVTVFVVIVGTSMVVYLGLHALSPNSFSDGLSVMLERNQAKSGEWAAAVEHHRQLFTDSAEYNRLSVFQPMDHRAAPMLGLLLSSLSIGVWYNVMNQTVIQRVLGAKDAHHARLGLIFSGILFAGIGFLVILPGLIMFALHPEILLQDWSQTQASADRSYIELVQTVLPVGMRGLLLAALFGAIQSTLTSILNSTGTIFAIDIYRERLRKDATETQVVRAGAWASGIAMVVAIGIAILVSKLNTSIFYYIQSLNAFFAAPFAAIFMLGVLWKRMNAHGALVAVAIGFAAAVLLKFAPDLWSGMPRWTGTILNQAAIIWTLTVLAGIVASLRSPPPSPEQVSEQLTFSWSNRHVRSGWGDRFYSNAFVWWLVLLLITAAIVSYFSPLVFH